MEMRYSEKGQTFYVKTKYEERHVPKEAGFSWDKFAKAWCTPNPVIAERLAEYADEEAKKKLFLVRELRNRSSAVTSDYQPPAPDGLEYLPYQRAGIEWGTRRKRVLIADEMGLGKTIQAIGVMNVELPETTLIVCPASLKLNWLQECQKWFMGTKETTYRVMNGTLGHTDTYGLHFTDPNLSHTVIIVNYDVAWKPKVHDTLGKHKFDLVILDECHYLKNPKTNRTKGVIGPGSFSKRAEKVVCLTGTPLTNRPIELFPILKNLAPEVIKPFTDYYRFGRQFCAGHEDRFGWNDRGASNMEDLNARLRSGFMIRRLKKDVLKDLPDKRLQIVPLGIEGAKDKRLVQKQITDLGLADLDKQGLPDDLGELATQRHDLALMKHDMAVKHIKDLLLVNDKLVIFAHHTEVIHKLWEALHDDYGAVRVVGQTPPKKRQTHVDFFQNDPKCRVFLGNLQAAGVGLTLTAASTVVFVEFSWVPGEIAQAVDRCHRIGQKDSVLAQFLVIQNSLEEHMMRTVLDKVKTINKVVDQ